jgi:hypothetical protein
MRSESRALARSSTRARRWLGISAIDGSSTSAICSPSGSRGCRRGCTRDCTSRPAGPNRCEIARLSQ